MTHRSVKKQIVSDIKVAVALGTPIYKCCDALGIQTRTYYRWTKCTDDKRAGKARANLKSPKRTGKGCDHCCVLLGKVCGYQSL